jgi:hypothetical protein
MGKNDTPALVTGNHYFIIFTDRKTRLRFGLGLKNNAEESILVAIEEWNKRFVVRAKEWYSSNKEKIHISLLSDNLELKYKKIQERIAELGIHQYYTAPRHSSSNGLSERSIGVVRVMARAMLKARDLPIEFWEAALSQAIFIANRIPFDYKGKFQIDPYQQWTGRVFDYSKIRIFGSRCYVLKAKTAKDLSINAEMGIYVGHAVDSNAYKCYIPSINDFVSTEDIRFQERATDVFEEQKTPVEYDYKPITNDLDFV